MHLDIAMHHDIVIPQRSEGICFCLSEGAVGFSPLNKSNRFNGALAPGFLFASQSRLFPPKAVNPQPPKNQYNHLSTNHLPIKIVGIVVMLQPIK
jgi:hypothetical protein